MHTLKILVTLTRFIGCSLALFGSFVSASAAVDWDTIKGSEIELFYPGQASWEWAMTQSSHAGAAMIRQGKSCHSDNSAMSDAPAEKNIETGNTCHPGFAIHNNHASGRKHHVSFEHTLILDKGKAAFMVLQ